MSSRQQLYARASKRSLEQGVSDSLVLMRECDFISVQNSYFWWSAGEIRGMCGGAREQRCRPHVTWRGVGARVGRILANLQVTSFSRASSVGRRGGRRSQRAPATQTGTHVNSQGRTGVSCCKCEGRASERATLIAHRSAGTLFHAAESISDRQKNLIRVDLKFSSLTLPFLIMQWTEIASLKFDSSFRGRSCFAIKSASIRISHANEIQNKRYKRDLCFL